MALGFSDLGAHLHNNNGGAQGSGPFSTGEIDIPATSLILAKVHCGSEDSEAEADYVLDSPNLDWSKIDALSFDYEANNGTIYQLWAAENTGSQIDNEIITVTHTGHTGYQFGVLVEAWTGYNTSDPLGEAQSNAATGTSQSLTFTETPGAGDMVSGSCYAISGAPDGSTTTIAPGTGFVETLESGSPSSFAKWQSQRGENGTDISWTLSGIAGSPFDTVITGAVIVHAAAAGGTPGAVFRNHYRRMKAA